jgi:hypothetical protein
MTVRRQVATRSATSVKVSTPRSSCGTGPVTEFTITLSAWNWHGACFSYLEP